MRCPLSDCILKIKLFLLLKEQQTQKILIFFEKKNLTTAASFPKVQTVNSFPIDDFSILSFRKESTPNIKKNKHPNGHSH